MVKVIFYDWVIGMKPLPFYKMLHEKTTLSLTEALNIRVKVTDNEIVEVEVDNMELAEEIVEKSLEYGVMARIKK